MTLDLNETCDIVVDIVRDMRQTLREGYATPHEEVTKSSSIDIVTETDKAAEAIIVAALQQHFSEHQIVGEEGGSVGATDADYYWYVDPIDGTTNFASGIPHFCTSIALADAEHRPIVGVIYQPLTDELYTATRGGGAFLNGQRIQVSSKGELVQSVLSSGFGYDKHTNPDNNIAQWNAFVTQVRGIRRLGSAALDFAYVAAGRLDGYWEKGLNRWDALAGMLLVQEAGGLVTDYRGGDAPQFDELGRYVASNGALHSDIIDVLVNSYGWS